MKKKITFKETDKNHADLKIRLKYDGIKQQLFFNSLIEAYLNKDDNIMNFIFDLKEKLKIQTIAKRRVVKQRHVLRQQNNQKYGLSVAEKETIYDMITNKGEDS